MCWTYGYLGEDEPLFMPGLGPPDGICNAHRDYLQLVQCFETLSKRFKLMPKPVTAHLEFVIL